MRCLAELSRGMDELTLYKECGLRNEHESRSASEGARMCIGCVCGRADAVAFFQTVFEFVVTSVVGACGQGVDCELP